MKRCPQCRREYDLSMSFCLDDGSELLYGPAFDGPATAILHDTDASSEAGTKPRINTTDLQGHDSSTGSARGFPAKLIIAATAVAIILGGGFVGVRYFRADAKQINSIAVMPFVNESGNADNDYLSDGVTESLIKSLSNIPNMSVKARSSVFRYKGASTPLKEIAKELGVQALLNGRVTQRADEIMMSLELIDGATENVLWTESYTRKQSELAAIQSEIARDVSNGLKAKLSAADQAKVTKEYTVDAEAYLLYLRGLHLLNVSTTDAQKQSIQYFDQAIAADPNFAQAYSSKADAYALLGTILNAQLDANVAGREARAAADEALRLDPTLSSAYTSRGWIEFRFDWDWGAAEADFKQAIALDPKNGHAHHWYGEFLGCMGRQDEGIHELRTARDLEPFSPIISWNLGKNLFTARRYDEALAEFQRTLELDGNFVRVFRLTSSLYEQKGMVDEAFAAFLKQPENSALPADRISELKHAYETKGLTAARKLSAQWFLPGAPTPAVKALAYTIIDEKEKAIDSLEQAFVEHVGTLVGLNTESTWDPLRNDPRFKELIRKMKFPNIAR